MKFSLFLTLIFLFFWTESKTQETDTPTTSVAVSNPVQFITQHEGTFNGQEIAYTATAGETFLYNDKEEALAAIWSVSYTRDGAGETHERPVTFIFNGGPGSASVWLHMGFFGPKVVQVPSGADQDDGAAPYTLVDNPKALLDLTDLVFIDPVGTGFSRVIGKGKEEDFWGLNEDARSIAQFMRIWITKQQRWMSPKYIAGESFGTMRAAAVANELEGGGQNMALNGLILISQALDYDGSTSVDDNITSYVTYLPSMAATAWYHQKAGVGKSLSEFVEEARQFTYREYVPALYRGSLLTDKEQQALAQRLSYFIGLSSSYILRANLRVLMPRFQKELLRAEGLSVGRLDGRYKGEEIDHTADRPQLGDPASYQIGAAYTAALNHYLAQDLKVKMERPYLTSNGKIGQKWNWRDRPMGQYWEPSPVNVSRRLATTMRRNPAMKILVACGYYDLITPFFDAEYTFTRNGLASDQVELTYYKAGHMMYNHKPDFDKLDRDIRAFLLGK